MIILRHEKFAKNELVPAFFTLEMFYENQGTIGASDNAFYWLWRREVQKESPGGNL